MVWKSHFKNVVSIEILKTLRATHRVFDLQDIEKYGKRGDMFHVNDFMGVLHVKLYGFM